MNPLAAELNTIIEARDPELLAMLSPIGRQLFFPKGILSQSAEAKVKAHRINATIGIATEGGDTMCLNSVASLIADLPPRDALTYAPSFGIPEIRQVWREAIYEKNPSMAEKTVSLPVVTNGITHGIATVADLWAEPGDVVVLPEMMWGNYNLIFNVRKGARLSTYALFDDRGGYHLEAFEATLHKEAAHHDKIIVLLNFPQNPSGYTVTEAEADHIANILTRLADSGTRVVAVFDDAYFGLFYDDQCIRESIFARICDRHHRLLGIKLDGATKENYVWGLRVGFITYGYPVQGDAKAVYDALERKTAGCIRGTISNASHLGQRIVLRSMQSGEYEREKAQKYDIMKARAEKVKTVSTDAAYADAWEVYPFNSGYFMCLKLKTVDAEALRVHLLDRYGIGLIALGDHNLRIAFSCLEADDVGVLFETIYKGIRELTG